MRLFRRNKEKTKDTVEISLTRLNEIERVLNNAIERNAEAYGQASMGRYRKSLSDKDWDIYTEVIDKLSLEKHWIMVARENVRFVKDGKAD